MQKPENFESPPNSNISQSYLFLEVVLVGVLHQHGRIRLVLLGQQADIVLDLENSALGLVLDGLEVEEQIVLDSRDGVGLEVLVGSRVELSSDANELVVGDHAVDVARAPGVAAHDLEQIGRGTRSVNGVLGRVQAVEPELAIGVGAELAAEVVALLVLGVKDVVLAVGTGLPHVEHGVGNTLAGLSVPDDTVEVGELAILGHVQDDAVAVLPEGSLGRPERSQNGRRCGRQVVLSDNLVVDLIDETRL